MEVAVNDDLAKFRHATDKAHKKMAGCMEPSFLCKKCKRKKKTQGRRQVVPGSPKYGYHCKECAA